MIEEQFVPWIRWRAEKCILRDQQGELWEISREGTCAWMRILFPGPMARQWANKWKEMVRLPYVVGLDALEDVSGTVYIRMSPVTALMEAARKNIEPEHVLHLGSQIGAAVGACRRSGIPCCPVVPANIYVAGDGSFLLDAYGAAPLFLGEPQGDMKYFRAPEEERGRGGALSEVYDLGLIMYWLLNERRMPLHPLLPAPMTPRSEEESYRRRMSGEKLLPPKNGSEALQKIILRACDPHQRKRWKAMDQLVAQLQALESGQIAGKRSKKWLLWLLPAAAVLGLVLFFRNGPQVPADAVEFGGHHYRIYDADVADYDEAVAFCRRLGGELAAVTSEEENRFLYEYLYQSGYDHVFLGASDSQEDGNWRWSSGEAFGFYKWAPGEPNNDRGSEEHIAMYRVLTDGSWNDITFQPPGFRDEAAKAGAISATSQLVENGVSYGPSGLSDGDMQTVWFEGASGLGSGEAVTICFQAPSRLVGMGVMAGDQRSPECYERASRPAQLELAFDDSTVYRFMLEDVCSEQYFDFDGMVTTGSVTVTIRSVYPGDETEHTGITELWFRSENGKTGFFCEWDH